MILQRPFNTNWWWNKRKKERKKKEKKKEFASNKHPIRTILQFIIPPILRKNFHRTNKVKNTHVTILLQFWLRDLPSFLLRRVPFLTQHAVDEYLDGVIPHADPPPFLFDGVVFYDLAEVTSTFFYTNNSCQWCSYWGKRRCELTLFRSHTHRWRTARIHPCIRQLVQAVWGGGGESAQVLLSIHEENERKKKRTSAVW